MACRRCWRAISQRLFPSAGHVRRGLLGPLYRQKAMHQGGVRMDRSFCSREHWFWLSRRRPTIVAGAGLAGLLSLALIVVGAGIGLSWPHLNTFALQYTDDAEKENAASALSTIQMFAVSFGTAARRSRCQPNGVQHTQRYRGDGKFLCVAFPDVFADGGSGLVCEPFADCEAEASTALRIRFRIRSACRVSVRNRRPRCSITCPGPCVPCA